MVLSETGGLYLASYVPSILQALDVAFKKYKVLAADT
jgi:hypothetical protein